MYFLCLWHVWYLNILRLISEEETDNWVGWRQMFGCGFPGRNNRNEGRKTTVTRLWFEVFILEPQRTFLSFLPPPLVATDGHVSKAAVVAAIRCRVFFPLSLVNDRHMRGKGSKLHEGFKESAFPRYAKETKIWKCFHFFFSIEKEVLLQIYPQM